MRPDEDPAATARVEVAATEERGEGACRGHLRWCQNQFEVDTDPSRVDLEVVHDFLSRQSYWAGGIPRGVVELAVRHSIVFGLYHGLRQIGFARAITDRATFAYVADVFVDDAYRRRGLGKWLMECVSGHPDLQGLRRWLLATRDAHGLYRKTGWEPLRDPTLFMERSNPTVYAHHTVAPSESHPDLTDQ